MCGRETKDIILLHRQCEHKCEQLEATQPPHFTHTRHFTQRKSLRCKDDTGDTPPGIHYSHAQSVVIRYTRVHPHVITFNETGGQC